MNFFYFMLMQTIYFNLCNLQVRELAKTLGPSWRLGILGFWMDFRVQLYSHEKYSGKKRPAPVEHKLCSPWTRKIYDRSNQIHHLSDWKIIVHKTQENHVFKHFEYVSTSSEHNIFLVKHLFNPSINSDFTIKLPHETYAADVRRKKTHLQRGSANVGQANTQPFTDFGRTSRCLCSEHAIKQQIQELYSIRDIKPSEN